MKTPLRSFFAAFLCLSLTLPSSAYAYPELSRRTLRAGLEGTVESELSAGLEEETTGSEIAAVDVTPLIPVLLEAIATAIKAKKKPERNREAVIPLNIKNGVVSLSAQTLNKILPKAMKVPATKSLKLREAFANLEVRLEITELFHAALSKQKPFHLEEESIWENPNAQFLRSQEIWRVQVIPTRDAVEFFAESAYNVDSAMLAVQEIQRRVGEKLPVAMHEVWTVLILFHNLVLRDAADQTFDRFLKNLGRRFPEEDPNGDFRNAALAWQKAYPILQKSMDLPTPNELEKLFSDTADQITREIPKDRGAVIDFSSSRVILPSSQNTAGLEETLENRFRRSAEIFKQRGWFLSADSFAATFLKAEDFLRQDLALFEQRALQAGGADRLRRKWRRAIENKKRFLPVFSALMEHLSEPASGNHNLTMVNWKSRKNGYEATLEYQFEDQPMRAVLAVDGNPEFPMLRISLNRKVSGSNPLLPIAEVRIGKDRDPADLRPKPPLHLDILIAPAIRSWLEHEDLMPVWSKDPQEDPERALERFQSFLTELYLHLEELRAGTLRRQHPAHIVLTNSDASFDQVLQAVPQRTNVVYRLYTQLKNRDPARARDVNRETVPESRSAADLLEKDLLDLFGPPARQQRYFLQVSNQPNQPGIVWIEVAPAAGVEEPVRFSNRTMSQVVTLLEDHPQALLAVSLPPRNRNDRREVFRGMAPSSAEAAERFLTKIPRALREQAERFSYDVEIPFPADDNRPAQIRVTAYRPFPNGEPTQIFRGLTGSQLFPILSEFRPYPIRVTRPADERASAEQRILEIPAEENPSRAVKAAVQQLLLDKELAPENDQVRYTLSVFKNPTGEEGLAVAAEVRIRAPEFPLVSSSAGLEEKARAVNALRQVPPAVPGSVGEAALVFREPETFDLAALAVRWGWNVAVLDDGPEADALKELLDALPGPKESYAVGLLESTRFLEGYPSQILIEDRPEGFRVLGLRWDDLPPPVAAALESVLIYLDRVRQA